MKQPIEKLLIWLAENNLINEIILRPKQIFISLTNKNFDHLMEFLNDTPFDVDIICEDFRINIAIKNILIWIFDYDTIGNPIPVEDQCKCIIQPTDNILQIYQTYILLQ